MPRWQWIICKNGLEFWRHLFWENGYPTFCGSYLTFMLLYEKRWASSVSWPQLPGISFFSHKNTLIFITERPLLALCYSNFEKPRRSKDQSVLLFSRKFRFFFLQMQGRKHHFDSIAWSQASQTKAHKLKDLRFLSAFASEAIGLHRILRK